MRFVRTQALSMLKSALRDALTEHEDAKGYRCIAPEIGERDLEFAALIALQILWRSPIPVIPYGTSFKEIEETPYV